MTLERDAIWALSPVCGALWMLGGSGQKWIRRWIEPAVIATAAISFGVGYGLALASAALLVASHYLGYSPDKNSTARIAGIASLYGLALAPILWPHIGLMLLAPILTGLVFTINMKLSRRFNWYTWKWVECFVGMTEGALVAWRLLR